MSAASHKETEDTFTIVCKKVTERVAARDENSAAQWSEDGLSVSEAFKKRLERYREKIVSMMSFTDHMDVRNP